LYLALAYGFVTFTALLVVILLWFSWQENRRRRKLLQSKRSPWSNVAPAAGSPRFAHRGGRSSGGAQSTAYRRRWRCLGMLRLWARSFLDHAPPGPGEAASLPSGGHPGVRLTARNADAARTPCPIATKSWLPLERWEPEAKPADDRDRRVGARTALRSSALDYL